MMFLSVGLNWSGVQSVIWVGMAIDNARKMPLSKAFHHAFKGEKAVYHGQDICHCVPCRFDGWQQKGENQLPDDFHAAQNTIEAVAGKVHRQISPEYSNSSWLNDLNHRLTPMNSPPLVPPPRSFV